MNTTGQDFSFLYEISRALVSNRNLQEILSYVVEQIAKFTGSKICSLMLLDEARQELVIKATQSLSLAYLSKPSIKVGEGVSGRAVQLKKPVAVHDVTTDQDYKYPAIAKKEGLRSLIAVPLMVKGRAIGVLNCYTAVHREFTSEEIQMLTGIASQLALAIENARLSSEKIEAQEKLEVRKKVEQAKGIVMKRYHVDEKKAHRMLQKKSMDKRRSLREIADVIILSEEIETTKT